MTGMLSTTTTAAIDLGTAGELVCRECGCSTPLAAEFACAECFGPLEIGYDFEPITRSDIESGPPSIWRYRKLLPVPDNVDEHPNTEPGLTRLIRADRLAKALGLRRVWVKDDTGNPTHSFKDRVVADLTGPPAELALPRLALASNRHPPNPAVAT